VGVIYVARRGLSTGFNGGIDDTLLLVRDPPPPRVFWHKYVLIIA
jgi:hypothetical protein